MASRPGRKMIAFRLTEECIDLLTEMANRRGISKTAMIELIVRDQARQDEESEVKLAA